MTFWSQDVFANPISQLQDFTAKAKAGAEQFTSHFVKSKGYVITFRQQKLNHYPRKDELLWNDICITKADLISDSYLFLGDSEFRPSTNSFMATCHGINSKYCFELQKRFSEKTWNAKRVELNTSADVTMSTIGFSVPYRRPSRQAQYDLSAMRSILPYDNIGLVTLFEKSDFHVESLSKQSTTWVLAFNYSAPRPPSKEITRKPEKLPTIEASLIVDAQHFLPIAIEQKFTDGKDERSFKGIEDYQFDANGRPMQRTAKYRTTVRTGDQVTFDQEDTEKTTYAFGPVPESEFTLSAFGLPEPVGVRWGWHMPMYGWILIGAGVCGGLWFLVHRRRVRLMS